MIASAARYVEAVPYPDYLELDVYATGERARCGRRMTQAPSSSTGAGLLPVR